MKKFQRIPGVRPVAVGIMVAAISFAVGAITAPSSHADVVVRIDSAKGLVNIRDAHTGRVMAFKASSADLANLKVGDEVKANWKSNALVEMKGVAKTAALVEPDYVEPCCGVVAVVKDRAAMQALLGGIFAEPGNNTKDPAEPVNGFTKNIKGIDAINGVQADFGNVLDGAEPVNGIILARNIATGALHVLNASVLASDGLSQTSAPITSSVRIGDPVSIDAAAGIAMLKSGTATYAFNLRGIKKYGEPINDLRAWVVEPDANAKGQYGIVKTEWHEKAISGHRSLYVYLPGEREKHEYYELQKREHSVLIGEYDMKVNGVLLEKVPVKAGHATRILMGALHYNADYANQLSVFDAKDRLSLKMQGGETFAIPIGNYYAKVGTRTMKIEIKENQVTEF